MKKSYKNYKGDYYAYKSDAYAVSDSAGHYFEFGELDEDSAANEELKNIGKDYNKEILEIQSVRDLC